MLMLMLMGQPEEEDDTAVWDERKLERRRTWRFMIPRESERESEREARVEMELEKYEERESEG